MTKQKNARAIIIRLATKGNFVPLLMTCQFHSYNAEFHKKFAKSLIPYQAQRIFAKNNLSNIAVAERVK